LLDWCKGVDGGVGSEAAVIIIAHVDKKGGIAGPKQLEHHVDGVFSFMSPSKRSTMRSLGCEGKNRFGASTGEIFFEMTDKGLVEKSLDDEEEEEEYSVFDSEYEENVESAEDLDKRVAKSVKRSVKRSVEYDDDGDDDDGDDSEYGDFSGNEEDSED
jgi:hypothetical protein